MSSTVLIRYYPHEQDDCHFLFDIPHAFLPFFYDADNNNMSRQYVHLTNLSNLLTLIQIYNDRQCEKLPYKEQKSVI